jgi:hypothetical protein
MAQARQRLAAYDERLPGPPDATGFFKELGLEDAESLFRGPSKAPFALSPCAPLPEQAAEVLAIRLACRREGFLFIEEAAQTSGDSALAPAAEVVLAVDGNDQEHLALALDACRTRAEAAFGLLETVLEALAFSSPRRFARTLKALAGPERT